MLNKCPTPFALLSLPLMAALVASAGCMVGEQPLGSIGPDSTDDGNGNSSDDTGGDGNGNGNGNGGDEPGVELGCATQDSYSASLASEAEIVTDDDDDTYHELIAELATDPLNQLEVSLWAELGAFTGVPVGPGSYEITGDDLSYEDCGLCLVLWGDVDPVTDDSRQMLMAQSGTVEIDSIVGTMSGTLTNVVFKEVNPVTEVVKPGGCETTLSMPFSAAY